MPSPQGYEELSATHNIGGVVYYELLDQPHMFPSSEALYGMIRVQNEKGGKPLTLGSEKPVFSVIEAWNTKVI